MLQSSVVAVVALAEHLAITIGEVAEVAEVQVGNNLVLLWLRQK
jgi:hypothetical protein